MASPAEKSAAEKPKAKGRPRKEKTQTQSLQSPPAASSSVVASIASPGEASGNEDVGKFSLSARQWSSP
ncbi:hypothetical protein Pmar_PMAR003448 [Perkinsus marinus ATCC 50983]|uniref:Uncharacterized protein n=1 Tax=Perkinsus marinus (strain ATCC 50983 / TXsc) TaxID=423536 RepID=C5KHC5_PERM5|nr:hypothetical protein Pmar_PMAR003448 [Perkinsus marinus ATCC 50983]EER15987.1 hypothetical protein Pmar_PMAR003448 [Perkinsus marinus ATCC 50983]|eukprot:XP_002784191.1 hypothetical protein Pmar_PMAR003448 [Perkinsus marinus ATCC 50983]